MRKDLRELYRRYKDEKGREAEGRGRGGALRKG